MEWMGENASPLGVVGECRSCGADVPAERIALGLNYCAASLECGRSRSAFGSVTFSEGGHEEAGYADDRIGGSRPTMPAVRQGLGVLADSQSAADVAWLDRRAVSDHIDRTFLEVDAPSFVEWAGMARGDAAGLDGRVRTLGHGVDGDPLVRDRWVTAVGTVPNLSRTRRDRNAGWSVWRYVGRRVPVECLRGAAVAAVEVTATHEGNTLVDGVWRFLMPETAGQRALRAAAVVGWMLGQQLSPIDVRDAQAIVGAVEPFAPLTVTDGRLGTLWGTFGRTPTRAGLKSRDAVIARTRATQGAKRQRAHLTAAIEGGRAGEFDTPATGRPSRARQLWTETLAGYVALGDSDPVAATERALLALLA